jgi:hypothetical protein
MLVEWTIVSPSHKDSSGHANQRQLKALRPLAGAVDRLNGLTQF